MYNLCHCMHSLYVLCYILIFRCYVYDKRLQNIISHNISNYKFKYFESNMCQLTFSSKIYVWLSFRKYGYYLLIFETKIKILLVVPNQLYQWQFIWILNKSTKKGIDNINFPIVHWSIYKISL